MKTNLLIGGLCIAAFLGGIALQPSLKLGAIDESGLTDTQLYILTEILQNRTPALDASKHDVKSFAKDYADLLKVVRDNITEAVTECQKHRAVADCSVYERIKTRINEVH